MILPQLTIYFIAGSINFSKYISIFLFVSPQVWEMRNLSGLSYLLQDCEGRVYSGQYVPVVVVVIVSLNLLDCDMSYLHYVQIIFIDEK